MHVGLSLAPALVAPRLLGASGASDGDGICASCNAGFTLNGNPCQAITCTCTSGTAATEASCTSEGENICASCNAGFTLYGKAGQDNTCTPALVAPRLLVFLHVC